MKAKRFRILLGLSIVIISAGSALGVSFGDLPLSGTPVRFAIIGDRTSQATPGVYEEIVAEIENMKPDFVVTVGDAIQGYTNDTTTLNSEWDEYLAIIKPLTMPIYLTPGNHDITTDAALGTYRNRVGQPYYSFNVRNFHFVVLDASRWESSEKLPKDELSWLAKDLAANQDAAQTLVFYHKPFWYDTIVTGKPDTLHSLFKTYGVDAVFNGHLHTYFSARIDGILYTSVGSSGGIIDAMPSDLDYHFTWVTLDDSGITIAPIKKGAVKPWNIVTASEEHIADNLAKKGLRFSVGAVVLGDMSVSNGTAELEVNNVSPYSLDDTVRWEVPRGWSVQPSIEKLTIAPGEEKRITFQTTSSGKLYPLPKVILGFPYAENKSIPVSKNLRISRIAFATRVTASPKIDGKLKDECWREPIFRFFDNEGGQARTESTLVYFAYDNGNLYLGAHCRESKIDSLRAAAVKHDGPVTADDYIGFFLQPDIEIDTAYQIYFNPAGTVFDQKIYIGSLGYYSGDKSWNGAYVVKTKKGKGYWDIEAVVPLARLGAKAGPNRRWGLNFLRKQKRLNATADWQIPIDYDPQTFGLLQFQ
jgi:predicted phosphodiesterase